MMKAKILNEYLLGNPVFCGVGQNDHFHRRFVAKLQVGENDFRKMAALLFIFIQRLVGLLFNSFVFSNPCCIIW